VKVVMPSTPYDAKGLLVAAVNDGNPVMYIDDRWLYQETGNVPEEMYEVPIGKGVVRRPGKDVTIAATSYMAAQAVRSGLALEERGVDAEVIDLRSIKPWDQELVFDSVRKTGRLVVADAAWETCGVAAEIAAAVACNLVDALAAPIARVCLPDAPAPMSAPLEKAYYPGAKDIVAAVEGVMGLKEVTRHAVPSAVR
jgi:pyruvate dehydrogenase E1 component beta subunit